MLFLRISDLPDGVVKVLAINAGVDDAHTRRAELTSDIVDYGVCRSGSKREDRRFAYRRDGARDLEKCRTEIVSPL